MWCSGPSSSWDLHEDGRPLLSEPPRHARCPFHPLSCGPETEQEEGTSINTLETSAYLADDATRELLLGSTCFLRPALPSFECATQRHGPPRRTCRGAPGLGIGSGREVQLESANTRVAQYSPGAGLRAGASGLSIGGHPSYLFLGRLSCGSPHRASGRLVRVALRLPATGSHCAVPGPDTGYPLLERLTSSRQTAD